MSELLLITHCAPTLAGLKTANLYTCPVSDPKAHCKELSEWNHKFAKKGVLLLPLCYRENRALLFLYRPDRLRNDLRHPLARRMLAARKYPVESVNGCVYELSRRLAWGDSFPHEIGLFLGYPPEDVEGFIRCNASGEKCCGAWKVYGDEDAAKRAFDQYQKCTRAYLRAYEKHQSVDRLIVSGS